MIPKVIHYCWFSKDPYPHKIKNCIESWCRLLPDYKIKKWDYSVFPKGSSKWVDQAFNAKKYAFAADYIRAYALYHEGGIYLDSDVEVIKSFDPLLDQPYFIGQEIESPIEAAAMGAYAGLPLFAKLLQYYDSHEFLTNDGNYNDCPMPYVMDKIIREDFNKQLIPSPAQISNDINTISILPSEYFSPKSYIDGKITITSNTFCIHHFSGSWVSKKDKLLIKRQALIRKISKLIGEKTYENARIIYHKFKDFFNHS